MKRAGNHTALFSTDNGFIALNGPVKLKILDFLKTGSRSFDEIVKHTGKAKSTISVHITDLKSCDLLEEKIDPNDKRKKIYNLNSQYMACSQEPIIKHYNNIIQRVASSSDGECSFLKSIFHAIRFGFEAYGINHEPIMKKIGADIGESISVNFKSTDLDGVLKDTSHFWKTHNMGDMSVISMNPLTVIVYECFDCKSMPVVGKTLCSFDEGLLEGIIYGKLGLNCTIKETECFGNGYKHCLFVMQD
ncbi:MAG TPA: ArsR family transcriptional regulator [Methanosarcinaceae archaeon]|nr:ArsR family transcriptional regulator [Methanosarcinaceae archaeon]